jgi:hypothetical protein
MPFIPEPFTVTIADEGTTSNAFQNHALGLAVFVPTIDSATITFHGCSTEGGTYAAVKDSTGTLIAVSASTGAFWLDGDFVARFKDIPWLKVVLGAAQTNGPRSITICRARDHE